MELTRPMLAAPTKKTDWPNFQFPTLASAKIDGIRALCRLNPETGKPELVSRTLKLIPNRATQERFARLEYVGLDGELVVGLPTDKNLMQQTTSGVMSEDGDPDAKWYVFDKWNEPGIYCQRACVAKPQVVLCGEDNIRWVPHLAIYTLDSMVEYEGQLVAEGYEGMMLRHPDGLYKQGRSTLKQQWLLKIKRFEDSEAVVLDCIEQQTNNNEAITDERGYTKRSTHAAGKEAAGVLGALTVRDLKSGIIFDVGTGFTAEQRRNLWEGRQYLTGKIITYKHFAVGVVDKPRFPTFKSFRDRSDI